MPDSTPILIDPIGHSRMLGFGWWGPWLYGDRLFLVLNHTEEAVDTEVRVFSSGNNGQTWVEEDSANAPVYLNSSHVAYRGDQYIYIAYKAQPSGQFSLIQFDMATRTFGPVTGGGPTAVGSAFYVVKRASDWVIIYTKPSGASGIQVCYVTYDGGWGAEIQVSTNMPTVNYRAGVQVCAVRDSDDRIHIIWSQIPPAFPFTPEEWYYRKLKTDNTFTAIQNIASNPSWLAFQLGYPAFWGTKIVVPYIDAPGDGHTWVFIGEGYANDAPVWSREQVDGTQEASEGFAVAYDSSVAVFWIAMGIMDRISYSVNSGSGWGPPILVHDEAAFPTTGAFPQLLHGLSVSRLGSGFGIITMLELQADAWATGNAYQIPEYTADYPGMPDEARSLSGWRQICGPFLIGGHMYTILDIPRAFRSDDQGHTWNWLDSANDPLTNGGSLGVCVLGSLMYLSYWKISGGNLQFVLRPFDTATDTWGAEIAGSSWPSFTDYKQSMRVLPRSDGSLICLYTVQDGASPAFPGDGLNDKLLYSVYRPGTGWGPQDVRLDDPANPLSYIAIMTAFVGSGDRIHVAYGRAFTSGGAIPATIYHRSLSGSNVLSAVSIIYTENVTPGFGGFSSGLMPRVGIGTVYNGQPAVPLRTSSAAVAVGSSESAPSWSIEIANDKVPGQWDYGTMCLVVWGSELWYLFEEDVAFAFANANKIWRVRKVLGIWTDEVEVYDSDDDPYWQPPAPLTDVHPVGYPAHNISVAGIGNDIGVIFDQRSCRISAFVKLTHSISNLCVAYYIPYPPLAVAGIRPRVYYRRPFYPGGFMARAN